ncbi:MAG: tryptophanyl-tRNA synthetase, partial [halophilic archaeon J07HX5]
MTNVGGDDQVDRPSNQTPRTDGGTKSDNVSLNPWGSATVSDYRKLFKQFGIQEFETILGDVPNPHYLMRRGVIFGHRGYDAVAAAMRNDEPFAALSGFMPTGDPHIGHKLVFDELIWHQQQGGDVYGLIADLEAHAARELSWGEIDDHARDYVLSLLALGFDPDAGELYRQSTNRAVQDLGFELGAEANFSELRAIYDFDGETDVSHMQSVVTQMADILYPQLEEPKPTVIPVGPDQDPHVRLARDLAARVRYFGVTEAYASFEAGPAEQAIIADAYERLREQTPTDEQVRCVEAADLLAGGSATAPDRSLTSAGSEADQAHERAVSLLREAGKEPLRPRVRFVDRNATGAAFTGLIEAIDGEKRVYEEHIDAFELEQSAAETLARTVELDTAA